MSAKKTKKNELGVYVRCMDGSEFLGSYEKYSDHGDGGVWFRLQHTISIVIASVHVPNVYRRTDSLGEIMLNERNVLFTRNVRIVWNETRDICQLESA